MATGSEWTEGAAASSATRLEDGSRVAVVGGGPAGSFFAYFLLDMAERMGLDLSVDIYETRDFSRPAPLGCNMCGGIISESLVQALATEGIDLPPTIVQRGIDSYTLHTDTGHVRIETPLHEMRIGAVYRGSGPRDIREMKWGSFDGHLQALTKAKGARVVASRVDRVAFANGRPQVTARGAEPAAYDLLAGAVGVNSGALTLFAGLDVGYRPPEATKTFIREYYLGEETIDRVVGRSMHVFLLNIPRLEFAAVIPKGDYVSICLLGENIDAALVKEFLNAPSVRGVLPDGWAPDERSCQCSPRINIGSAAHPFGDRLVFIGDCAVTRLYKDGIGAAYRTAKAAAKTAIFEGIDAASFERHYAPACRAIEKDNAIGKFTFAVTRRLQGRRFARRAVVAMTAVEQHRSPRRRRMSRVLWDMFTGSASYRTILWRSLHPFFLSRLLGNLVLSLFSFRGRAAGEAS